MGTEPRPTSALLTAAQVVFLGLPCLVLFRLWVFAMAEQFKPAEREPGA